MGKAASMGFSEEPFWPLPPRKPSFDPARDAWVLSRYADLCLALREPVLQQASPETREVVPDEREGHERLYAEVKTDVNRIDPVRWRVQMEESMTAALDRTRARSHIDLVHDLLHPWSVAVVLGLAQPEPAVRRSLERIARRLFFKSPALPDRPSPEHISGNSVRPEGVGLPEAAEAELDALIKQRDLVLSKPMFFGFTQTLPSFIANAWLALLLHPGQLQRLIEEPAILPGATEELLRYAGIVQTLFRRASARVKLGELCVEEGQFVYLEVAAANYDPARFRQPNKLDLTRMATGHLALGTGTHGCVGAMLVRMACMALLPIIARSGLTLDQSRPVLWNGDGTLKWSCSVPARWQ